MLGAGGRGRAGRRLLAKGIGALGDGMGVGLFTVLALYIEPCIST